MAEATRAEALDVTVSFAVTPASATPPALKRMVVAPVEAPAQPAATLTE
jgi:hypothetical protein